jgi:sugar phosphate isomerase/epimerase
MQRFRVGAVTDVFSPDAGVAAQEMRRFNFDGAELRTIGERSILDASDGDLRSAIHSLNDAGLEVVAIASPLLKCSLEEWKTQSQQAERAFDIANVASAKIVRVFSGARIAEPEKVFERVVDLLQDLSDKAAQRGLVIALENDRACNIATAQEMAGVLAAIDHSNLQVVWDPASAYISGEKPFPTGYHMLDTARIALVHAKDCTLEGHKAVWEPLGDGDIDWQGQIDALASDGYAGYINLETYWPGVGDCLRNLKRMVESLAL